MACGKPIITTKTPGCKILVKNNGKLIAPGNVSELKEALLSIIQLNLELLGNESYKLYHNRFSEKVIFNQILDIYHS